MMKYLKKFENFNLDFKIGDLVVCVDDSCNSSLKYGETYKVSKIKGKKLITIKDLKRTLFPKFRIFLSKDRFVKQEDFGDYKIYKNATKYNL